MCHFIYSNLYRCKLRCFNAGKYSRLIMVQNFIFFTRSLLCNYFVDKIEFIVSLRYVASA